VLTLAFANTAAYARFDPQNPTSSRFVDEDLNRVWGVLDGVRDSAELRRARALRPVVDAADYLLDIHSMQHATAPLQLAGPLEKGRAFARQLTFPRWVMCDAGHAAGLRMRDYGAFSDPASPKNALLIECGQHWERSSADVAIQTVLHFLRVLDMADPAWLAQHLQPVATPQTVIEITEAITVRTDRFAFVDDYLGMEIIPQAGTLLGRDGDLAIRTPYDDCVLIMPSRRLHRGNTAVRLGRIVA
jgi:predicted deacylase